ncbi:arabinose-proton symporter [Salmonella enterica subsp. enterica]|uniref:Arabinose-proton symporter n=1 Tax=Salmonella enterica I TaxID=59201 RepID=A0A3S4HWE9_SALET|nr:arabinose-proton symporter [Salmonella enterica subsp. enterica]
MVSINHDSALTPRSLRDTRRMNMFVSVSAAVAGLLFGLDIGVIAGGAAFYYRPFRTDQPAAGMGRQQYDAWRGNWRII